MTGKNGGDVERIAENLLRHVAHLIELEKRTGKRITLAIEPEPHCYLETVDECVGFFQRHLFSAQAVRRLGDLTGLDRQAASVALHDYLGLCLDLCHAAVEFEDRAASIAQLRANGILIAKLQLSSALRVAAFDEDSARHLAAFAEPVYLHQVVQKSHGSLRRFVDLPQALAASGSAAGSEWRVHFHVPVFLEQMAHFGTTQAFLAAILALHRADPISRHLEVETYTWDVLPPSYRGTDLSSAIARELNWVKGQLLQ